MANHSHHFDPTSGWCACGLRRDNKFVKKGTLIRQGVGYNPALDELRIDQIIQNMKEARA